MLSSRAVKIGAYIDKLSRHFIYYIRLYTAYMVCKFAHKAVIYTDLEAADLFCVIAMAKVC